jgi:hypothetical protein
MDRQEYRRKSRGLERPRENNKRKYQEASPLPQQYPNAAKTPEDAKVKDIRIILFMRCPSGLIPPSGKLIDPSYHQPSSANDLTGQRQSKISLLFLFSRRLSPKGS